MGKKDIVYDLPEEELDPDRIAYNHDIPEGEPVQVKELWAYVMTGEESHYSPEKCVTDLCYFSADVNSYGELSAVPDPEKFVSYSGRLHLVGTCTGRSLTHMVLEPSFGLRDNLVNSLVTATKGYDGLQIDYENVPFRDRDNFIDFLSELRNKLPKEKMLTVALAARTREIRDDSYSYTKTAPLVDRIIIMAYDEHWSGSKPGSVASIEWCDKVSDYCKTVIPEEKLVMGLPFYGRSWQTENFAKAWRFNTINREMNRSAITHVERDDGIPFFTCIIPIEVTAYFDDVYSLVRRCRIYEDKSVDKIAFWRLCQEDPEFWNWVKIEKYSED